MEVNREEISMGKRFGSVVFFNACEVGTSAASFGELSGWPAAFAARRFRAFIAPLWAVEEEASLVFARALVQKILRDQQPIGEALRDIRAEFGPSSPTFYAYLLYGDVRASIKK